MIRTLQCLIENNLAIDFMYCTMEVVGDNINKQLPKSMDWEVALTVVHTMKNIVNSIIFNQATFEKLMLSQAAKWLLNLYVSMSKCMVTKLAQKTDQGDLFDAS